MARRFWAACVCLSLTLTVFLHCGSPILVAQDPVSTKPPSASATQELISRDLDELVLVKKGRLPIVISAPHGGVMGYPDVAPREGKGLKTGPSGFFVGRDGGTLELALAVAEAIEKKFGDTPYYVISATHRKYLDPNRPADIAFESELMRPVYDRYHDSLQSFVLEIVNEHRSGLLLDLHGQGSRRDTVFRGTGNGKTVQRLRESFGEMSHAGEVSLFGLLKNRGWTVHPDPHDGKEQSGFTGGYIVQSYGSHRSIGIDAMQLELGAVYRSKGNRQKIASELADSIYDYAMQYLPTATRGQKVKIE